MSRIHDAAFSQGMAAHAAARRRAAIALDKRQAALARELSSDEKEVLSMVMSDSVLVEHLRKCAWHSLDTTLPTPKAGWPRQISSAEDMWRIEQWGG